MHILCYLLFEDGVILYLVLQRRNIYHHTVVKLTCDELYMSDILDILRILVRSCHHRMVHTSHLTGAVALVQCICYTNTAVVLMDVVDAMLLALVLELQSCHLAQHICSPE